MSLHSDKILDAVEILQSQLIQNLIALDNLSNSIDVVRKKAHQNENHFTLEIQVIMRYMKDELQRSKLDTNYYAYALEMCDLDNNFVVELLDRFHRDEK